MNKVPPQKRGLATGIVNAGGLNGGLGETCCVRIKPVQNLNQN